METLLHDLRFATRVLLKSPGFTAIAVLTLALGIGANCAIFSVVNAMLIQSLPFRDPDRLMWVWDVQPQLEQAPASYPEFVDWRNMNQVFEQMAAGRGANFNLTGTGDPERLPGYSVTANFFQMVGINPELGRAFLPEEDKPGNDQVVLLSTTLWRRRFGSDHAILGKTISLNGKSYNVIGVIPPMSAMLTSAEVFTPMGLDVTKTNRGLHFLNVLARLRQGTSMSQAQANMGTIAAQLKKQYSTDHDIRVARLREVLVGDVRRLLLVLFATVGFVLLIACTNVANLQLARANSRQKELSIRLALGASRWRVVRQWLTESALLALLGGSLGVLMAYWGVRSLTTLQIRGIPTLNHVGLDGTVLVFTLGLSLLAGFLFGLMPALHSSKPNLSDSLKEGSRGSSLGSGHRSTRSLLMVNEVAMALVLLVCAGLMIRSFQRLMRVQPGFEPENVLTLRVNLPVSKYTDDQKQSSFYRQVLERIEILPGVVSAGLINNLPLGGGDTNGDFQIEGAPPWPTNDGPMTEDYVTSPNYFQAMRIPLLKGRLFTDRDNFGAPNVSVINEAFARRVWPNQDPLGKRIQIGWPTSNWLTIVGVVGDVKHEGLDQAPMLQAYVPYLQGLEPAMTLVVRTQTNPLNLVNDVRNQILAVDKDQPVFNVKPLAEVRSESVLQKRLTMIMLALFAAVALILACVGIYGVVSYSAGQRTHEIGIRMALGAGQGDVLGLIIRQGMLLVTIGILIGAAASLLLTRFIRSLLFGVSATDPLIFSAISLLLAIVAFFACYIPARRATRVDPVVALRCE